MNRKILLAMGMGILLSSGAALLFQSTGRWSTRGQAAGSTVRRQEANFAFLLGILRRSLGDASAGGFRRGPGEPELGDPACDRIERAAWERVEAAEIYQNEDLRDFNRAFRLFNDAFPSFAESTLCHLTKSLGMELGSRLPRHFEKTFRGKRVELDVSEPSESWANEWGYDTRAVLRVDGLLSIIVYWSGGGDESRGFLIEGIHGLSSEIERHAGYTQWDRTGSEQFVKHFGAEFESSYLESAGVPLDPSHRPDRAVYGEVIFHPITSAVFVAGLYMEPQRGPLLGSGQFGCYRVYAKGTKNDAMLVAKTSDLLAAQGHARNTTFRDAVELEGAWLRDNPLTRAGSGRLTYPQFAALVGTAIQERPFTKSCNDLYTAGVNGGPFSGTESDVRFEARPEDIFEAVP